MSNSKIKPYYLLFTITFLFAITCIVLSKADPMYWNLGTIFKSMINNRGLYLKYLIPISISFILTISSIIYGIYILVKQVNQRKKRLHGYYQEYSIKELIVLVIMILLLSIYLVYVAWYLFLLVVIIGGAMWWVLND